MPQSDASAGLKGRLKWRGKCYTTYYKEGMVMIGITRLTSPIDLPVWFNMGKPINRTFRGRHLWQGTVLLNTYGLALQSGSLAQAAGRKVTRAEATVVNACNAFARVAICRHHQCIWNSVLISFWMSQEEGQSLSPSGLLRNEEPSQCGTLLWAIYAMAEDSQ